MENMPRVNFSVLEQFFISCTAEGFEIWQVRWYKRTACVMSDECINTMSLCCCCNSSWIMHTAAAWRRWQIAVDGLQCGVIHTVATQNWECVKSWRARSDGSDGRDGSDGCDGCMNVLSGRQRPVMAEAAEHSLSCAIQWILYPCILLGLPSSCCSLPIFLHVQFPPVCCCCSLLV